MGRHGYPLEIRGLVSPDGQVKISSAEVMLFYVHELKPEVDRKNFSCKIRKCDDDKIVLDLKVDLHFTGGFAVKCKDYFQFKESSTLTKKQKRTFQNWQTLLSSKTSQMPMHRDFTESEFEPLLPRRRNRRQLAATETLTSENVNAVSSFTHEHATTAAMVSFGLLFGYLMCRCVRASRTKTEDEEN